MAPQRSDWHADPWTWWPPPSSRVTDSEVDDVEVWQQRPLDDIYLILYLDAFVVKARDGGSAQRKACYLALGLSLDGEHDVLAM